MSLLTKSDVIRGVRRNLDDPAGVRFKPEYVGPFVDQANEDFLITLEKLGVQLQEQIAIFNIPAATSAPVDLTPYYGQGKPLQYLMRPKAIDWKAQGQPDTSYIQSQLVSEIDDVSPGNLGCPQWRWAGGSIQLTANYGAAVTLRIYFDGITPNFTDGTGQIVRGIGNILMYEVVDIIAGMNNQMGKLQQTNEKRLARSKRSLCSLLVMQGQAKNRFPRSTKRGGAVQISAGGVPYI